MIYELSRRARRQIEDIIRYTDANFGDDQTAEYVTGLYHSFDILSDNPEMGRQYDERRRRYIYRKRCPHPIERLVAASSGPVHAVAHA